MYKPFKVMRGVCESGFPSRRDVPTKYKHRIAEVSPYSATLRAIFHHVPCHSVGP